MRAVKETGVVGGEPSLRKKATGEGARAGDLYLEMDPASGDVIAGRSRNGEGPCTRSERVVGSVCTEVLPGGPGAVGSVKGPPASACEPHVVRRTPVPVPSAWARGG